MGATPRVRHTGEQIVLQLRLILAGRKAGMTDEEIRLALNLAANRAAKEKFRRRLALMDQIREEVGPKLDLRSVAC